MPLAFRTPYFFSRHRGACRPDASDGEGCALLAGRPEDRTWPASCDSDSCQDVLRARRSLLLKMIDYDGRGRRDNHEIRGFKYNILN